MIASVVLAPLAGHLVTSSQPACIISTGGAIPQIGYCQNGLLHESVSYRSIGPILILGVGALLLLVVSSLLSKRSRPGLWAALTIVIGGLAAVVSGLEWSDVGSQPQLTIGQQVAYDRFGVLLMLLISLATVLGALCSDSYLRREGLDGVEPYVLMLLCGSGAMLMAVSAGLIMLFLGLEIMSIALYVLAAYHRRRTASGEAGFKYFILGSFSSAIFLYGAALVYGATGSTQFSEIAQFLQENTLRNSGVLVAGMMLIIVGLGFKVAAVPFHFWSPDVYQGSPTPFTGYMASVAKAGGFAGLLRVLVGALSSQQEYWRPAIWLIAVLTLVVGSVLALTQRDVKRMLAYSSISQAGYILVGLQADSTKGTSGDLYYLLTYTFIVAGTFAVVQVVQGAGEARNDLGAFRGLARRSPWLAASMLVLLLAQAGVPLTSGFLGKLYVIQAVVDRGQYPLAVIAMVSAAIAAFFYLRLGLIMYSSSGESGPDAVEVTDTALDAGLQPVPGIDGDGTIATLTAPADTKVVVPPAISLTLAVCVVFTIFAGVTPAVVDFAQHATQLF